MIPHPSAAPFRFGSDCLPALLVGVWVGVFLYGKLDDAAFRKVILVLLLVSGLSLAVPAFLR